MSKGNFEVAELSTEQPSAAQIREETEELALEVKRLKELFERRDSDKSTSQQPQER